MIWRSEGDGDAGLVVLADGVQGLVLDRAELTHEVRAADRRGAGGDAGRGLRPPETVSSSASEISRV